MSWRGYKGQGYATRLMHYWTRMDTGYDFPLCRNVHKLAFEDWIDEPMPHCGKCEKIITNHPERVVAKLLKQE